MRNRFFKRLINSLAVVLVVSLIIFLLINFTPGDAAEGLVGDSASQQQLDSLRHEMGLDQPLLLQYFRYIFGILTRGDFGHSLITGQSVAGIIRYRLLNTMLLALVSTGLGTGLGIAAAVITTWKIKRGWVETAVMAAASLGLAIPAFWSGLILILVVAPLLNLPITGGSTWRHLILPAATLAPPLSAVVIRLLTASLKDILNQPFVLTARGKGLNESYIFYRHVLRCSLIPLFNVLGIYLGRLLGGAFIVESIFGWPGLGRLMVQAIFERDTPLILGTSIVITTLFVLINLLVDLSQAWLDPRVREKAL